jgi:cbb3-type cytochrome oxidase maturation protein
VTILLYLLVVSLATAACGLGFFLWSLRSGQYDDLDGAANRILFDDETEAPRAQQVRPETRLPERIGRNRAAQGIDTAGIVPGEARP